MKKLIDRYGHCICCGKNLVRHKVIEGKKIVMMAPDHSETCFKLDDGTLMRVCTCKKCKSSIKNEDCHQIMENVKAGWKAEVEKLVADESKPAWTEEFGKEYLQRYGERSIIGKTNKKG